MDVLTKINTRRWADLAGKDCAISESWPGHWPSPWGRGRLLIESEHVVAFPAPVPDSTGLSALGEGNERSAPDPVGRARGQSRATIGRGTCWCSSIAGVETGSIIGNSLDFPAPRGEVSHGHHDEAQAKAFVRSQNLFGRDGPGYRAAGAFRWRQPQRPRGRTTRTSRPGEGSTGVRAEAPAGSARRR